VPFGCTRFRWVRLPQPSRSFSACALNNRASHFIYPPLPSPAGKRRNGKRLPWLTASSTLPSILPRACAACCVSFAQRWLSFSKRKFGPNLYHEISQCGARLAVVNGRISNRTWPQYHSFRWFFAPILKLPDCIIVQSPVDCDRYSQLDVPAQRLSILGNLKYEAVAKPTPATLPAFGADHIWIAASTVGPNERGSLTRHDIDEDQIVIDAFKRLAPEFPKLLLILAPRQPARFEEVARQLAASGIPFLRRTELNDASALALPGILLLDSIGELAGLYSLADVVFVGGSLAPRGGHNIIEPGAAGVPVVIGPHMHNFEVITRDFLEHQAVVQIQKAEDLPGAIRDLLTNPRRAAELGKRAQQFVRSQQGVSEAISERLWPLYYTACWRRPRNFLARFF
jgi:3-deoxy-D-manno-octulosonic-acid transferase